VGDVPFDRIRLFCVYKDVHFSVDNASHTKYRGDVINGLKYFGVEANSNFVDDFVLMEKAIDKIGLKSIEVWQTLTGLDFEN